MRASGGYIPKYRINKSTTARLAKNPTMATNTNLKNCFEGLDCDSWKTKYLVIKKLTTTPIKNDMDKEIVEFRKVYDINW